jgi:ATP-dependent DNA helicase RecG
MSAATTPALPAAFKKLGILRWVDLLLHFPLRYENESEVCSIQQAGTGRPVQLQVEVLSAKVVFRPRRMLLIGVEDETGTAFLRFIYFKEAMRNAFVPGQKIRVLGEARRSLAGLEFIHPRIRNGWLAPEEIGKQPLVAVYPTTAGLAQASIRKAVLRAVQEAMPKEWLPQEVLDSCKLMPLPEAIRLVHFPPADADRTGLAESLANRMGPAWDRIRFDELLAQQVALRRARAHKKREMAPSLTQFQLARELQAGLPFCLTAGQARVWQEISYDLQADHPMQRLLQGDVGSGKTVVAALAAAQAVGSNGQVAVMAPTEILAEQLFSKFKDWFAPLDIRVELLVGGLPAKARKLLLDRLVNGELAIVVGTHALIQKDLGFKNLALVIVDEQHRFGVGQRLALRGHGMQGDAAPHLLAMSATPIPRSLAMTYLADLDVSSLDERPPNRQPILTKLMSTARRDELIERLKGFIAQGGQAYWVCPVIEDDAGSSGQIATSAAPPRNDGVSSSRAAVTPRAKPVGERGDPLNLAAIKTAFEWLSPIFKEQLVVLHGRMSAEEKKSAMELFAAGHARLMLATTVIEVGVDVPNATLMVIEHAERFGLAQLHQLRGRVGRGPGQSTCILLFEEPLSELARERLKTLYETDDGFEVARRDLSIRGPGELLGLRQSGLPTLRYSDLQRDALWVDRAVAFGAKCCAAPPARELGENVVNPADLDSLVQRWAFDRETLMTSG